MAKQVEGQMSLFDFPEYLPQKQKEPGIICKDAAECEAYPRGCGGTISPCRFGGPFKFGKPICKHSGHSCNKEELWKVAETFDEISCSRTCCRECTVRMCGARCNGSEEPKRDPKLDIPRAPIWHYSLNHVWEECPNCKAYNKASVWRKNWNGSNGYWEELPACPECGQVFDWSDEAIDTAAKYSKDYLKAQEAKNENIN